MSFGSALGYGVSCKRGNNRGANGDCEKPCAGAEETRREFGNAEVIHGCSGVWVNEMVRSRCGSFFIVFARKVGGIKERLEKLG